MAARTAFAHRALTLAAGLALRLTVVGVVAAVIVTLLAPGDPIEAQTPAVPTPSPSPTATRTPTVTPTATQTPAPAPTSTPPNTPTPMPTATNTPMPAGIPASIVLAATPNTVTSCPAKITLNATVKDGLGAAVPDGTVVSFITNGGSLAKTTALTSKGVATTILTLDRNSPSTDQAPVYSVAAGIATLIATTNVQEACQWPVPTATAVQCTGNAKQVSACKTAVAKAAPPPQAPIQAAGADTAGASRIRPPSTGDGALLGH